MLALKNPVCAMDIRNWGNPSFLQRKVANERRADFDFPPELLEAVHSNGFVASFICKTT
jgi:hypothetical protein